jgi:poly-gamma-glutamate capsule biosynthesis protein CapA/YwtB (metallophosphatase superfamily)
MFAGDIMSQVPQINAAERANGTHNYTPCFQYIRSILETADLAIGNLECTLSEKPPYTGYPHFISPNQLAKALKINGFDILVTANNHSLDNGSYGVENTIETLREEGFVQTGTFKNSRYKNLLYPLIVYKNGYKIALLNYTHHTNGLRISPPNSVNRLEMEAIKHDLDEAKKMKPDFIITFLHWGNEHVMVENDNQRSIAKLLHQWGADLIVGGHPHVVQPIKLEHFSKNKPVLVAYSLGNFISSQPFANTEGGILLEVDIEKTEKGTVLSDYHYIPVLRYTPYEKGSLQFYALPVSPYEGNEKSLKMPSSEQEKMANFAKRVRQQLNTHGVKEHRFELDLN